MSKPNRPDLESDETPDDPRAAAPPRPLVTPPIDIYETPEGLTLVADLPGVSGETVDVQVQDNKLTLFGRLADPTPGDAVLAYQEFVEADFLRSFILSDDLDHDRIEAALNGGVLTVKLPRQQRSAPRRIDVAAD